MDRKGQGAMEYLMTYGWAILVVIIVGVVLWQMGIFNPSGGTSPGMIGFGNVESQDWSCDSATDTVYIQYVNAFGQAVVLSQGQVGGGGVCTYEGASTGGANPTNVTIPANKRFVCTYAADPGCAAASPGTRFESTISVIWSPEGGGITHTETGTVWKGAD